MVATLNSAENKNNPIAPMIEIGQYIELLREQGFRITPQREKILAIFHNLPEGDHLSAETLNDLLTRDGEKDVSLATTYRTLKLLASLGVLRELDFAEDHKHYELVRDAGEDQHQHLVCIYCGYTEEFTSPEVFKISQAIAEQSKFQLIDSQLKLYGVCQPCQEKPRKLISPRQKKEQSPHSNVHQH